MSTAQGQFVKVPVNVAQATSDAELHLYVILASYAWGPTGVCTASQRRIANDLGWSRSKVQRVAKQLIQARYVACDEVNGKPNQYRLTCVTDEAGQSSTCVTHDAPPASPMKQVPASPVKHEVEAGEVEEGSRKAAAAHTSFRDGRGPTPRQLEKLKEMCEERGLDPVAVSTRQEASAEIDRLSRTPKMSTSQRERDAAYDAEPTWDSVSYDGDTVQVHYERERVAA